ncbi:MAG: PTS sugar transporter subunit IIC [Lachnospiraceae bacterium]
MQLSALQIILLVLVAAEINVDRRGLSLTHARPVIVGFLCGLILGDMNSGLYIGGTFTLMSLGVAALGGSSVPDYGVATIIACAFAKTTGQGPEVGMTIGLPVGMLGVQMDVLYKICNSFIAQKSQKYANEKQFGKMYAILYLCPIMVAVFMAFPTAVALTAGAPLVQAILDVLPGLGNRWSVRSRKTPSGSWYCNVAPLHAGKEIFQLHSDRFCTQRIHGCSDSWYRIPWCRTGLQVLYG